MLKKIELVFVIVIIIFVLSSTIETFIEFQQEKGIAVNSSNILLLIGSFFGCLLVGIFKNIYLVIIFIAIKFASHSSYKKSLDETDFEKNKPYYRDVIKEYSISELNYIDEFKLEKKQSYTAKLLELENKKIIKIENGIIKVINKPNNVIDEKFVDSIKNNKVTMDLSEYESLIEEEALKKDLITKASIFDNFKNKKVITIMSIIYILMFIYAFWAASVQEAENVYVIIFIAAVFSFFIVDLIMVFVVAYSIAFVTKSAVNHKYKRTKKGKEINIQLDGLKLFMEKFSNIKDKKSQHLILWNDYLIYSVMFNINKKIQNDYSKYFTLE